MTNAIFSQLCSRRNHRRPHRRRRSSADIIFPHATKSNFTNPYFFVIMLVFNMDGSDSHRAGHHNSPVDDHLRLKGC
jgi:hypothetical protein